MTCFCGHAVFFIDHVKPAGQNNIEAQKGRDANVKMSKIKM
jgi:hypothetical protein